jgi:acyl-[acyl-carrier-protein]-phospholipid O-acyltransferase/long-chain-fatty-acid--[acyl-carrier-protein] ligase
MASDSIYDDVEGDDQPRDGLTSASFVGLLITQFLGCTNDNIVRWLVIGIGKTLVEPHQHSQILVAGSVCFILPYLLLAAPAGFLADRFSKRHVIVWCKVAEIVLMMLTVLAVQFGSKFGLFALIFLMNGQSALFGPAKFGSVPELLKTSAISSANGLLNLVTVLAAVVGTGVGNWLSDAHVNGTLGSYDAVVQLSVLVGIAVVGTLASLPIRDTGPARPLLEFPFDFPKRMWGDLQIVASDRGLWLMALGATFFWSLGAIFQLNIDQFVSEGGGTNQSQITPLLGALVLGVAAGSVLAGVWSNQHVELGLLPLASLGLVLFSFLLFTVQSELVDVSSDVPALMAITQFGPHVQLVDMSALQEVRLTASYWLACFYSAMLGIASGLFVVPVSSYLQHRSGKDVRGAVLAATNTLTFSGMLVVTFAYLALRTTAFSSNQQPLFSARFVFLLCSLVTLPVLVYIVWLIPQATIKFLAWLVAHTSYRIRLEDRENLPEKGGALLVANHVTWIDGLLLFGCSSRPVRLLIKASLLNSPWRRRMARWLNALSVPANPKAAGRVLAEARTAIGRGELVCLFAEGRITRSGQLQSFSRGTMSLVRGTGAPVVPVYLDELWGSIFSYRPANWWSRWFGRGSRPISIWFGRPLHRVRDTADIRHAVAKLGARAAVKRYERSTNVARTMIRACRQAMFRWKVADSSGDSLKGGELLMRSLILRRLLLREVLDRDEQYVGLLLPPSNGAVVVNAAVTLAGRVAVNLNYSVSPSVMQACVAKARLKHVLTSRKVMEKFDFSFGDAQVVYLEDLREKLTLADKLVAATQAYATPAGLLDWQLDLHKTKPDDPLTVIFTSGSTGEPKGVVLTYRNIASNIDAIDQVISLESSDVMVGILPFFHSFGFTVTLWGPLALDIHSAYHFNPLDARQVGKLAEKWKATILLSTPTFLRGYIKRVEPEQFASLDVVVAGAERLPSSLCDAFEATFGVRPVEGYGATELSPLVSVNVPPSRSHQTQIDAKEGTVGRPVPGVAAKIVDLDTGERLTIDQPGMLMITGPNVMKGYLDEPEKTADVVRDGWYVTGDVAKLDADGFITITGRESRFSKIGGEMVPHLRVEEAIEQFLEINDTDNEEAMIVVTAVPDARKGERLVVVHRPLARTPADISAGLQAAGLPNLWIPGTDSYLQVEQIPVLGSGKLDLKGVAALARERFGGGE